MAHPRIALGVEIPNADMRRKTDGLGAVGLPDGWGASTILTGELAGGTALARWGSPQLGGGVRDKAAMLYDDGRYMHLQFNAALAASGTRYVQSGLSPAGQLFGAEQLNPNGEGYWYYRLRFMFIGKYISDPYPATVPPLTVRVDVYNDTLTRTKSFLQTALSNKAAYYTNTWMPLNSAAELLDTSGWVGTGGTDYPCYARVVVSWAGGTLSPSLWAGITGVTLETVGPLDTTQSSLGNSLASATGKTYFELSKNPSWDGMRLGYPLSLAKFERLPSGRMRMFDPSSGSAKPRFELPMRLLTDADFKIVRMLWNANRGYGFNAGTAFGAPLPLVLLPNQPDFATDTTHGRSYYVNLIGDSFPLEYDLLFQPAASSGFRYRGNLIFEGR